MSMRDVPAFKMLARRTLNGCIGAVGCLACPALAFAFALTLLGRVVAGPDGHLGVEHGTHPTGRVAELSLFVCTSVILWSLAVSATREAMPQAPRSGDGPARLIAVCGVAGFLGFCWWAVFFSGVGPFPPNSAERIGFLVPAAVLLLPLARLVAARDAREHAQEIHRRLLHQSMESALTYLAPPPDGPVSSGDTGQLH